MPTSAATARATPSWSPVSSTGREPEGAEAADGLGRGGLDGVGDERAGRGPGRPSRPRRRWRRTRGHRRARLELVGHRQAVLGEQRRSADQHVDRFPPRRPCRVRRGPRGWRSRRRREVRPTVARAGGDGPGDRVLGGVLERAGEPEHARPRPRPAPRRRPARVICAGGDGAGLVEHDGVDPAGGLEHLGALDQDAELGAAAGADHQRGRRGQPEGARAGDDQHRDRGGERRSRLRAGAEPEPERGRRPARSRSARRRRRSGRPAAAPRPCRSGRPRPAAPSARAGCRRRPGWRARRAGRRR